VTDLELAAGRAVSRETQEKLEAYAGMVREEATHQNLVSRSTLDNLWDRHIIDSAQLVRFEPSSGCSWLDVGSGAGLPGIVIACLVNGPVTLVEPRRLRADFLHKCTESLQLGANVVCGRAERLAGHYDVITARAVAPLIKLFEISRHLSTGKSVWILPKGRTALDELAVARRSWQGAFHVEQSVTDAEAHVVIASGVRAVKP
jgi:16S rRNA (guanine527-N7)-methyltransferase